MPEKAMHRAPTSAASRGRRANGSRKSSAPALGWRRGPPSPERSPWAAASAGICDSVGGGRPLSDEPQAELLELLGLRERRRLEHEVGPGLRLRERHDLADVQLIGEERGPAIDAEGDAAVRWRAVVERLEHRPELLPHRLERVPLQRKRLLQEVAAPDAHGAAA